MFRKIYISLIAILSFVFVSLSLSAQTAAAKPSTNTSSDEAVMKQLTDLRDSFINQLKAEGFQPSLAPPKIVLDNPPSYGRYENDENILHIAVWSALKQDQQARFERLAAAIGGQQTGEQQFEDSIHRWVFIHELSHWWQACQHKISDDHYAVEYGANRIAAAYWRLKDPALMERTEKRMAGVQSVLTSPVPAGQTENKFFNEHYASLAPTRDYIWFQYSMVLKAQAEKPLPTFKQALQNPA
ncbi:MAG TPA: hypothetical protein VGN44_18290 [Candidatus Angelobacter sp.]|jgi:hypothetical protein